MLFFIKFRVQYVQNGYENCVHVDYHDDEQTAFPQAGTGNSFLWWTYWCMEKSDNYATTVVEK